MRVSLIIFAVFLCGYTAALEVGKDEEIDIDVSTIKPPNKKAQPSKAGSGGDDDEDEGSATQGDSSGSGSGEGVDGKTPKPTTRPITTPTKKPAKTKAIRTKRPTTKEKLVTEKGGITKSDKSVTTMEPVEPTEEIEPTTDENMMETDPEDEKEGDVGASRQKKAAQLLSTEVIAAVVVGGVCAIILIAFLVYRLRKRDEGSYALTDNSYKDTNKLRGDPGKEAFV